MVRRMVETVVAGVSWGGNDAIRYAARYDSPICLRA